MPLIPDGPEGLWCPDWKKPMSKVCKTCPLWTQREMTITQADGKADKTIEWLCGKVAAVLGQAEIIAGQREIIQRLKGNQAATESMRNDIVKRMDAPIALPRLDGYALEDKRQ
jgi:hypothetical protein